MTFQRDPYDEGKDEFPVWMGIVLLMVVFFTLGFVVAR